MSKECHEKIASRFSGRQSHPERRRGVASHQDALVLVIISLVAFVSIESLILFNAATPVAQTLTQTVISTFTSGGSSAVISNGGITTTSTVFSTRIITELAAGSVAVSSSSTIRPSQTSTTSRWTISSTATSVSSQRTTTVGTTSGKCTNVCILSIPLHAGSNRTSNGYSPATIVVVIGINNTLVWINRDDVHHTVAASSPVNAFYSGDMAPNQTYTITLATPGTYSYHCTYDSWMHASIIVKSKS